MLIENPSDVTLLLFSTSALLIVPDPENVIVSDPAKLFRVRSEDVTFVDPL